MSEAGGILHSMRERGALRGLPLAGMAGAGVLVGHWLAYVVALPNGHLRAELLADAGHAYWPLAIKACLALVIAGLGALTLRLAAGTPAGDNGRARLFLSLIWRLALAQLVGFTVLEISERMAVGAPLADLWQHHLFVLGFAVQVAVAVAGALLLVLFTRVVVRILAAMRTNLARPVRIMTPGPEPAVIRPRVLELPGAVRAPPSF